MSDVEPRLKRIREHLQQLAPEMQNALMIELERQLLGDGQITKKQLTILAELRNEVRKAGRVTPRIGNPSRLFFNPIEPFLVDGAPSRMYRGYIARGSLNPIWLWLCRDVLAAEAKTYVEAARRALLSDDAQASERLAYEFRIRVTNRIEKLFASSAKEDWVRDRLYSYMAPPRAIEDLKQIISIFRAQDELAALSSQLPHRIEDLEGPVLENVLAILNPLAKVNDDRFHRSLFLVKSRLASPAQLVRLASHAARGNQAKRIAKTPYMLAIALVVSEIEGLMSLLSSKQTDGEMADSGPLVERIHQALRTVGLELNVGEASPWGRSYDDVRTKVSQLLNVEIEAISGSIERLLEPSSPAELEPERLSEADIATAEKAVVFFSSLRDYTKEFRIGNALQNAGAKLKIAVEQAIAKLLFGISRVDAAVRKIYLLQIEAAVRFSTKLFGRHYATTIVKSTEDALKRL